MLTKKITSVRLIQSLVDEVTYRNALRIVVIIVVTFGTCSAGRGSSPADTTTYKTMGKLLHKET